LSHSSKRPEGSPGLLNGIMSSAAERAAHDVDQGADTLMTHRLRYCRKLRVESQAGQGCGRVERGIGHFETFIG